jgi:hypothetical protein
MPQLSDPGLGRLRVSCHASARKPAGSIVSRVATAVNRKLVAGVRAQGTG